MSWFDGIVLGVIGLSTAFASVRGFSREFASIMAIALAAVVTAYGFGLLGPLFGADGSVVASAMLGAALFVVAFIGFWVGFGWLADHIHRGAGRSADRALGGVFGAIRGVALVGLGYLMFSYYAEEDRQPEAVTGALTFPIAKGTADFFESLAPASTRIDLDQPAGDDEDEEGAEETEDSGDAAPASGGSQNALNAPMSPASYSIGQREGLAEVIATHTTREEERRDDRRPE